MKIDPRPRTERSSYKQDRDKGRTQGPLSVYGMTDTEDFPWEMRTTIGLVEFRRINGKRANPLHSCKTFIISHERIKADRFTVLTRRSETQFMSHHERQILGLDLSSERDIS